MANTKALTPVPGQRYKLVSVNSGKVLDVDGASLQDGAKVQQWTDLGGANQHWSFEAVGPVAGQTAYKLVCANSGKVLDVTGGSLQAGAAVVQWPYHGGANQQWYVLDAGNNTCKIQSVGSGKVLDVEGASVQDGARVLQWDDHSAANQHWSLVPVPSQPVAAGPPSATSQPVTAGQPSPQDPRRLKTQMNGFDTVVAVTQKAINTQLRGLSWVKDALQKQWVIQATDADGNVYGTLTANINAPKITINTRQFQPHTVIFTIPFKSGTLQSWKGFGPSATQVTTPFGAGDLAFRVDLNLQDADVATVPDQVKSAIAKIKNLGPGMFSVRQLLLDLENANLAEYSQALTTLPAEIAKDDTLKVGLQQYFAQLHKTGGNILGYTIRVNNPNAVNPETPTFPPTDLNFATHVYSDPSDPAGSDLDTLEYLVMTQHRPLPTTALPAGDYVVDSSVNGTMAIARSVYFDDYLLPKIASYTNITIDDLKVDHDSVKMTINRQAAVPFTRTDTGWTYKTSKSGSSSYDLNRISPTDHSYTASHTCTVTIPPGSNTIQITGTTSGSSHVETWWGIKHYALSSTFDQASTINWSITISLSAVGNGEQLIGTVTDNIPAPRTTHGGNDLGKFDQQVAAVFGTAYNDFSQQLSNILKDIDLSQIVSALEAAFSNHRNYFVFPGADSFFFKDPLFNNEGDLLVTVTYNFY